MFSQFKSIAAVNNEFYCTVAYPRVYRYVCNVVFCLLFGEGGAGGNFHPHEEKGPGKCTHCVLCVLLVTPLVHVLNIMFTTSVTPVKANTVIPLFPVVARPIHDAVLLQWLYYTIHTYMALH